MLSKSTTADATLWVNVFLGVALATELGRRNTRHGRTEKAVPRYTSSELCSRCLYFWGTIMVHTASVLGGVFAQRGYSANCYVVYPGNTPANHPPTEACMIHSKQHRGCRIQDPGTRGYRWWKTADFSHSARCAPLSSIYFRRGGGGGLQNKFAHSTCTAYGVPPPPLLLDFRSVRLLPTG